MTFDKHANHNLSQNITTDIDNKITDINFGSISDNYAKLNNFAQISPQSYNNTNEKFAELFNNYRNSLPKYPRPNANHPYQLDMPFIDLGYSTPCYSDQDLAVLPVNSFFIYIGFKLSTPFTSKDETQFYFHDNPIKKDWILKIPYYPPTGWKGSFRSGLRLNNDFLTNNQIDPFEVEKRLCGESESPQGRLRFFPTFFDQLGLEVINPHLRESSVGAGPIKMEVVPRKSIGVFALLYCPIISGPEGVLPKRSEVLEDLLTIYAAVNNLLLIDGFGAKTSSGYGRIESKFLPGSFLKIKLREGIQPYNIPLENIRDLQNSYVSVLNQMKAIRKGNQ